MNKKRKQPKAAKKKQAKVHPKSKHSAHHALHHLSKTKKEKEVVDKPSNEKKLDEYNFTSDNIPITITVTTKKGEFVPIYNVSLSSISKTTEIILERIRKELTQKVRLGMVEITQEKGAGAIESSFGQTIELLLNKYFPNNDEETMGFLKSYLIQRSLGMGTIEILMADINLEEIAINGGGQPVWVYHKKWAWLKTTIVIENDEQVRRYSTMIGRKVGRQISVLEPLMDATIGTGDRVNATLMPISVGGNTITLRKASSKPWTITDVLGSQTISPSAASMIWLGMQYELSMLIAGGTASGKTSMMNSCLGFFPPNQRVISIEDVREVALPSFAHWIPMLTRLPNPEGKGGIAMLDLVVNSLRQRPDRIIVGEIRRKREAEVLFEAIHTGHSVYATVHANDAQETINRLTNPPIEIPKTMLPAISMIIIQYRNRRTGVRRTFQVAEVLPNAEPNVLMQLDVKKGTLSKVKESTAVMHNIGMFTGSSRKEINQELSEKESVLKWLVGQKINTVETVGRVMAEYYTNKDNLMNHVKKNKHFGEQ